MNRLIEACKATGADVVAGDREATVLLAMATGAKTFQDVVDRSGYARSTTFSALQMLKRLGLVDMVHGRRGTLHLTSEVIRGRR